MKKDSLIYKVGLLGILCAICGLLLSAVNGLTAPLIAEAGIASEKANLELIYPGATFTEVENTDTTGLVTGVYEAKDKGYVYKISTVGYNASGFTFLIAFNNDGTVAGFTPIEQNESQGFGARCFEEEYTNTITSLTSADAFPLLSGATVTSTALTKGIDAAKALFNETAGISYDPNATAEPSQTKSSTMNLSDDFAENEATCEVSSEEGTLITYACNAKGFGFTDPNGIAESTGHTYTNNEANITVDTSTMTITAYEVTHFGDTEEIGDAATRKSALETYIGLGIDSDVDVVSGATYTSHSVASMAQAALNAAAGN